MTAGYTRRDVVRMSGLGAAMLLAGCSVGGDAAGEGEEFGIADVRIDNGTQLPLAAGIGRGGFAFTDDTGAVYSSARGAEGRVGEREIIDLPNGVRPGASVEGLVVGGVPRGTQPLYLTFTPPPVLYANSDSVAEHRFFWQVR